MVVVSVDSMLGQERLTDHDHRLTLKVALLMVLPLNDLIKLAILN